jgi:light-regulated signal transduction histidine kinase (bacteriophytochrome)
VDVFRQSKPLLFAFAMVLTLLVGVIDYLSGYEISVSVFYLAPICFVTWFIGSRAGIFTSTFSIAASLLSDYFAGKTYQQHFIEFWNICLLLCFFLVVTFLLSKLKYELDKRAELIIELKHIREDLERKKNELARSNSELEQFAYVAAHDLRSPLLVIAGYTNRLQRRYQDSVDAEAAQMISYINESASRMRTLIDDLLSYARLGTNEIELKLTNLNDVISEAISNLRGDIENNNSVVTYGQLPSITIDGRQIVELFQNLLHNGIKFCRQEQARIHISVEEKEGEWQFSVSDNGIGIDMKDKERIFSMFQRLHKKDEIRGTGIGLAVCKKIVEHHGGSIWVDSEVGKGSTFYFTLPKKPDVSGLTKRNGAIV